MSEEQLHTVESIVSTTTAAPTVETMAEEQAAESSYFSYIWYTAVWYLLQFLVITSIHFYQTKKLDKQLVQKSAVDTLLLSLVFVALQWCESLLSHALYRLPFVLVHLFIDLIPTLFWLATSLLMLLMSLALAHRLYLHLTESKSNVGQVKASLDGNLLSMYKSQQQVESAVRSHVHQQFPKFMDSRVKHSKQPSGLSLLMGVGVHLLEMSVLALVLLEDIWKGMKSGYKMVQTKNFKDAKVTAMDLGKLLVKILISACLFQLRAAKTLTAEGRQFMKASSNKTQKKSMAGENGSDNGPSVATTNGTEEDDSLEDFHDDQSGDKLHDE